MAPLIVLAASFLVFLGLGIIGAGYFAPWEMAVRWAMGVMFIFTGIAHFTRTRQDIIRMVPPLFPRPALLVTITGVLEIAGGIGLAIPALAPISAYCLILLLVAMFPANVHAARERLPVAGHTAMPWQPRLALQLLWIVLLWIAV